VTSLGRKSKLESNIRKLAFRMCMLCMWCMTKGDSNNYDKLVGQYSLELEESIMPIDSITGNTDSTSP
jgi:hypothetical protein